MSEPSRDDLERWDREHLWHPFTAMLDHVAGRLRFGRQPGVVQHGHVDRGVQRVQLAELSAVRHFDRLLKVGNTPPLGAGLEDSLLAVHRVGKLLAIGDRDPARLLAIHVLACLGRQDRRGRMPAIPRGNQHGVDVLAIQQFAKVTV